MGFKVITAGILSALKVVFTKAFTDGLGSAPSDWEKVATMVPSSGATNLYGWLNNIPKMRLWVGERVLNRLKASGYSLTNDPFESSVAVSRTDIEDDNVGMYTPLFKELGRVADEHIDESVFGLLKDGHTTVCHDGQPFFNANHPIYTGEEATASNVQSNLLLPVSPEEAGPAWYLLDTSRAIKPLIFQKRTDAQLTQMNTEGDEGTFMRDEYRFGVRARRAFGLSFPQLAVRSTAPLTPENFNKAVVALRSMKTDNQRLLNIKPTLLVVPPALEGAAKTIVKAEVVNGTTNVNRDAVDILSTAFVA